MRIFQIFIIQMVIIQAIGSDFKSKNKKVVKKSDPNDNKGNTPFFLQDPYDSMCLGPNGFTMCNENALWILTKRTGKTTYSLVSLFNPDTNQMCLERKSSFLGLFGSDRIGMGVCKNKAAKSWVFEFLDSKHVKLSIQGQCLVRGKKTYKHVASLASCKKESALPLLYHPTAVHEIGFYLKAADEKCFDGNKFRACEPGANKLLWGVGIKYIWGKAHRYFFSFSDRSSCLVAKGSKVEKGDCKHPGALKWGLQDGQLSYNGGKKCVARLQDNQGVLAKCRDAFEYVHMDIPATYTADELAHMIKNQDKLTAEERAVLQQMIKQQSSSASVKV